MDKCKKILLLLISAFTLLFTYDVDAKIKQFTPSSNYKKTCITDGSTRDVANKYGLDYDIGSEGGVFYLTAKKGVFRVAAIEEGYYYYSQDNGSSQGIKEEFKSLGTANYLDGDLNYYLTDPNARVIGSASNSTGKAKKLKIKAKSFFDTRTKTDAEFVLRITLVLAESDDLCQTPEDFAATKKNAGTFTGHLYILLKDFTEKTAPKVPNENYNLPACQIIRQALTNGPYNNIGNTLSNVAFNNISSEGLSDYRKIVPFCFSSADVIKNYTPDQVITMVETAIQSSYAKRLPQVMKQDPDFITAATRACQAQGGTYSRDAFGVSHCTASGEHWQLLGENGTPTINNGLYCKYDWNSLGKEDKSIGYKYTNADYYFAQTVTSTKHYYEYQRDDEDKVTDSNANICTKTCEEAVSVEYGPPQAALAGFCFEYQVKVTSHVQCVTNLDIHVPDEGIVCVPTPNCVHKTFNSTQAGPTEEFDKCVRKCDGGEYSEACSIKCYNQVYKNEGTKNLADNTNRSGIAQFVADIPRGGKYRRERTSNGYRIYWESNNNVSSSKYQGYGTGTYAQWYIDNEEQRTINDDVNNHGHYFADKDGFKRQVKGGVVCNGKCAYQNCGDDTYLSQDQLQSDYQNNIAKYNEIVSLCAAQATCTEKTAEFTISANVNGKWIDYPLINGIDKLTSKDDRAERTENKIKDGSSLLSYNGCYANGNNKDWYQAEWSFPGTWANNKTGEISYVDKGNDKTWHQTKNKFCLPLTIKNTNQKWWFYFFNQKVKREAITSDKGSYTSDEYMKLNPEVANQTNPPSRDEIDWNIKAQTMKFGYFGWQFNINCFYASYSKDNIDTNPENFTTRPITNKDMFPSNDPDNLTETTEAAETGRTQGFNWTAAATIDGDTKNPYYAVNPEVLISKIQKIGNKIYDESNESEYLEYEFRLSPEALKTIRKSNKETNNGSGNYTNWDDTAFSYDNKKKIYIYRSPLIRGTGSNNIAQFVYKKPDERLLGCNNIGNNACENNLGGN